MEELPWDLRGLCAAGGADASAASGAPALACASALLAELQAPAQVHVRAVDGHPAPDVRRVLAGEAAGELAEGGPQEEAQEAVEHTAQSGLADRERCGS